MPGSATVSFPIISLIVKTVVLVGFEGMHKTGCSGETRLVLQHLGHHQLESVFLNVNYSHYYYCCCYYYYYYYYHYYYYY